MAAVGGGVYAARRRKRRKNAPQQNTYNAPRPVPRPQVPEIPLEELRTRAGSALLQADTTMSRAKQELEFARAQYGDQQVARFEKEIALPAPATADR